MAATLKELQEKRLTLKKSIDEIGDKYKNNEPWQGEDEANWTRLCDEYDANQKELDAANATAKKAADDAEKRDRRRQMLKEHDDAANRRDIPFGRDGGDLNRGPVNKDRFNPRDAEGKKLQALALQGWMLGHRFANDLSEEQKDAMHSCGVNIHSDIELQIWPTSRVRDMQGYVKPGYRSGAGVTNAGIQRYRNDVMTGKAGSGGVLVGETLLGRLEEALLSYVGVRQVAEVVRTDNGETLRWPTVDDTSNSGARVGEAVDAGYGTSTDPNFGRLSLQAFTFHSKFIHVSRSFMQDSVIDFEARIGDLLGTRIARKQNTDFTTGADVGNGPIGIVTAATLGVTTASSSAIAADELLDLIHTVDPAYRELEGVGFMYHDSIFKVLRKLKDGIGRYLWTSGMQTDAPDNLYGYPFWINQAMDSSVSSGKKTILFGKLDLYKIRDVSSIRIQRLVERRAEFDEDVFIAYMRGDGGLLDAGRHPVQYMTH